MQHFQFICIPNDQFWNKSVIKPYEGYGQARDRIGESLFARSFRKDTLLYPKPKPIKTPSSRPAQQWTKKQPVGKSSKCAKARPIVIPGDEPNAVAGGNVLPVAGTRCNQRLAVVRPKFEGRCSLTIRIVAL